MEHDETNHTAAEMHAEIMRIRGAELRRSQRDMVIAYASRGWEDARIAEALDITVAAVKRLLAADGRRVCTDCAFNLHNRCEGRMFMPSGDEHPCECSACRS